VCKECGRDSYVIVIVPCGKGSGPYVMELCMKCAIRSGKYCVSHEVAHIGYSDGTTACIICVHDIVAEKMSSADGYLERITDNIDGDDLESLDDWLDMVGPIYGGRPRALLSALAARSLRTGVTVDEVTERIISARSAAEILPDYW